MQNPLNPVGSFIKDFCKKKLFLKLKLVRFTILKFNYIEIQIGKFL